MRDLRPFAGPHQRVNAKKPHVSNELRIGLPRPISSKFHPPKFESRICESMNPFVINKCVRARLDKRECAAKLRAVKRTTDKRSFTALFIDADHERHVHEKSEKLSWLQGQKTRFHEKTCKILQSGLPVY